MAKVYRGTDTVLGRTVAIKVLSPHFARDRAFVERFRREAQAAARLNHPHVVSVYDTGSADGVHFIVMEHLEGRTLADVLKSEGRLLPRRAAEIAEQVAGALSFAHAAGLVHRDVKPGNIMLGRSGEVKVMDFGIARAATAEALTQTATILGTATYFSPEQAQGEPVDPRSDVYSLGIVLYEMLTGNPPFTGDSPVAIAYKHVRENPLPPSATNPEVPHDLDAVVMKALAKNPDNRYASAEEMRADLSRVIRGEQVEATPVLPPETTQVIAAEPRPTTVLPAPPPDEQARRSRRMAAGIVLGALIIGTLAVALFFLAKSIIGGAAQVTVPDVVSFPQQTAESQLRNVGLDPKVTKRPNATIPAGIVIAENPKAGTKVDQGSEVLLVVSSGVKQVHVPRIVGLDEQAAINRLKAAGLKPGFSSQEPNDAPAGQVFRQDPLPGTLVPVGSPVNYFVSLGPSPVSVPYVICLSLKDAENKITKAGLTYQEAGTQLNLNCTDPNKVAAQNPDPGTPVAPGSVVQVFASEPSPAPSPSPT